MYHMMAEYKFKILPFNKCSMFVPLITWQMSHQESSSVQMLMI